jgi:TonB family protein
MKITILLFTIIQVLLNSANAQVSNEKVEQIKDLNKQVVEKYKSGKLKESQEFALEALNLAIEVFGTESNETASTYYNLGQIFSARKKYGEAASYLQKSLEIYQLKSNENNLKIASVLDSLGVVLALDGKTKEAEKIIENLIGTAEKAFGIESKNLIPYIKTATDFYIYNKQFKKAESLFARRYIITSKELGKDSDELENINDEFTCYLSRFKPEEHPEKQEKFYQKIRENTQPKKTSTDNSINGGVINGKALSLPAPIYPLSARQKGIRGQVMIKVLINEDGEVVSAKAICGGDSDLQEVSKDAAMKAKFRPTTLNGELVKVSGIITYIFN